MRGVVYVAYGDAAKREARASAATLRRVCPDLPVAVASDVNVIEGGALLECAEPGPGARWAKLNLDCLSPFRDTLYLDADTRVNADPSAGFGMLDDGWEVVMAVSTRQGADTLGNCGKADREEAMRRYGCREVAGLQAGMMFWRDCEAVHRLFAVWRAEWARRKEKDQAALLRALREVPVRLWLLGWPWNSASGAVVGHRFGAAVAG